MPRLPLSSQPSVDSLPRDSADGRALLQSRLGRYGRVGAFLALGFLVFTTITGAIVDLPEVIPVAIAQLTSFVVALAVSYVGRMASLPPRALVAIDFAFTWINCGIFVALGFALPQFARPELIQLCCVTDLLAARAFLVPSTARRTALVGLGPIASIVVSTFFFYRDSPPHPDAPSVATYVQVAIVLGLVPVVVTAWTSHTIFGLRRRAREAMQLGQYTLLERIGAGGMGVVYKARHATLRRPTAIKLLPAERAGAHNLARFEREVQLTCTLTHPNTISIFDYGRSAEGILYYAMEYLDGLDLESIVALTGPLPERRVVHVLRQVCGALSEAHRAGLMHRDVKPQNILLCMRGGVQDVAKVVDFGLVKQLDRAVEASVSTMNMIVGTPLYMSPEAITRPSELDARGDLYALGAVGYLLLTGSPPFRSNNVVEICSQQLHSQPESLAQRLGRPITPSLEALILQCLHKKPSERPQSASELALALDALALGSWTPDESEAWWREHEAAIAEFKRQRSERMSRPEQPATLAVDLRERHRSFAPWHSGTHESLGEG